MISFDEQSGLSAQSASEIRAAIVADWENIFSDEVATLNTEPESPAGQIIDSMTALCVAKDSEMLNIANQFNPLVADGRWQDALGKIYFLDRKLEESTIVTCQCTGLQGIAIPVGALIKNTDGYVLESIESDTIPASGMVEIEFKTQETGAVAIGSGSCTKIITVIPGWDTVNNSAAGSTGRVRETRSEFEKRRYDSVAANAHGSVVALYGAIAGLPNVLDCLILENKTDSSVTKQGVALIGHSVAICVYGGADEDIAKAIYNKLDAGCGTNGNDTVTYTSEDGAVNTYNIVRPSAKPVYIEIEINETATTPATVEQDIKDAVYADFYGQNTDSQNSRVGMGMTIYASRFSVPVIKTANVSDLVSIKIGWSASPSGTDITSDADEEPTLDMSNITVVMNSL